MDNLEILIKQYFNIINTTPKIVPPVGLDNTFYIYTTGLANWSDSDDDIIDIWKKCRYNNIIKQIPDYFNNIIIDHYDPIESISGYKIDTTKQIDNINTILTGQDIQSETNKKTKQTFYKQKFEHKKIDKTKPYIVLDFASIYYYNYNTQTKNFYITLQTDRTVRININCIHIPYPSKIEEENFPQNNWCNNYYENIQYFTYDSVNKKITTFIELFFRILGENYISMYQNIYITEFIDKILYNTYVINYVQKYNSGKIDDEWLQNNIKKNLFIEFFEKLFEKDMNKEKIQEIENYRIYNLLKQRFNSKNK